jgi:hypothetical protein
MSIPSDKSTYLDVRIKLCAMRCVPCVGIHKVGTTRA